MRHARVYPVLPSTTESDMSTSIPIRVLILEDNSADAQLMMRELRKAGLDPSAEIVDTEREFSDGLSPQLDLILCDHALPQFNSKQALAMLRARGFDVPFIIVSGAISEENAVEAMQNGADDYLIKDRIQRLGPATLRAIDHRRMRAELRRAEGAFREMDERFVRLAQKIKNLS
jgi:DNA-binding response OmpR family regulator